MAPFRKQNSQSNQNNNSGSINQALLSDASQHQPSHQHRKYSHNEAHAADHAAHNRDKNPPEAPFAHGRR